MIIFDQLRISNDGQKLYIDIHVNLAEEFDNVYLDTISIFTDDKVSETNVNSPSSGFIYQYKFENNEQQASLVLEKSDFDAAFINIIDSEGKRIREHEAFADTPFNGNLSKGLFFVYVKAKGIPAECVPCCMQNYTVLGVVFNEGILYQQMMGYTKQLADTCEISKDFIDFILRWNGFKASVNTGHYIQAKNFYEMLFGKGSHTMTTYRNSKPCGCHG